MKLSLIGEIVYEGIDQIIANKVRSMLTLLGIILGVTSLIVMFSLLKAASERNEQWTKRWVNKVNVSYLPPYRASKDQKIRSKEFGIQYSDYLALKDADIEGINQISATQQGWYHIKSKENSSEIRVQGADNNYLLDEDYKLLQGRQFLSDDEYYAEKVCIIGSSVARDFFKGNALDKIIKINNRGFRIIGVLEEIKGSGRHSRWAEWRNNILVVPLRTMMLRLKGEKSVSLSYRLDDPGKSEEVNEAAKAVIYRRRGTEDFSLESRAENIIEFQKMQAMWGMVLGLISVISLIVGGIGITNIMLATIKDRIKEIGLKKSIGATSTDVKVQFLIEATLLSLFGGILGTLTGVLLSTSAVSAMDFGVKSRVHPQIILIGLLFALVVGLLSGLYPAIKASRVSPIEALRYE
ncbi:ABC transporter permease [bacterium]|nr:ABC transporter permease [bacterium]